MSVEVPPPTRPMDVARALVAARYMTKDEQFTLRVHRGIFYRWDGTCWPEVDRRDIRAAAYTFLETAEYMTDDGEMKPFAPTRRKIDDVEDAVRAVALLDSRLAPPCWTDGTTDLPAHEMVAMVNGLLHVPSRTLYPHDPRLFIHSALPFEYLPDTGMPTRWLSFLNELWPDDPSSISALQEAVGYIVGGDTTQQKIILLVGPKRGGKGTIGRVLTGVLGHHNVAAPTLASLSTNFGLSPLIDKPLALVSDARLSGRSDAKVVVERLLSISGEDSLTIDRKYREPWTGRLPTRFFVLTNELPKLTDSSGALASRFVILVLTQSFYGRENPSLTDELLTEAPAILNWAFDGLDRLRERGYFERPQSGEDAVQQLEDLSSPVSAFLRDECVVGASFSVPVDELWSRWKVWCESENRHPGTRMVLGRDLRAAVPGIKRARPGTSSDRGYVYQGVGLRGDPVTGDFKDPRPSSPRDGALYSPQVEPFDPSTAFHDDGGVS